MSEWEEKETLRDRLKGAVGNVKGLEARVKGLEARVKGLEARVKGLEDALLEVDRVIDDAATDRGDINHLAEKVRLMIAAALEKAGRGTTALHGGGLKEGE